MAAMNTKHAAACVYVLLRQPRVANVGSSPKICKTFAFVQTLLPLRLSIKSPKHRLNPMLINKNKQTGCIARQNGHCGGLDDAGNVAADGCSALTTRRHRIGTACSGT